MKSLPKTYHNLLAIAGFSAMAILSGGLLASCEDMLKEEPRSVAVETFFNTAAEVETAVNGIFSPLRSNNYAVYETSLECQSDFVNGRGSWAPLHGFQGLDDANITRVGGLWNAFYLSIRNANLVIRNAPWEHRSALQMSAAMSPKRSSCGLSTISSSCGTGAACRCERRPT